jgi:hypothetical protein
MNWLNGFIDWVSDILKTTLSTVVSFILTLIFPIHDYFLVILILASVNIAMGLIADHGNWQFRKAFNAFIYLFGYLLLLLLTACIGLLMHVKLVKQEEFISWITWVMIYFYVTNILRNWHIRQPDNRVIAFLYWVLSFKIIDKIQILKEFFKYEKSKKNV